MTNTPLEMSVTDYAALRQRADPHLLLDVREDFELAICRIDGSMHIPLGQLPARLAELESWRNQLIVCQCKVGGRSARATAFLRQHGFANATNLAGGILAWARSVDTTMASY